MPLTEFQEGVARTLASGRSPESYLAGGAALNIEPQSLRFSNDLDYFNDSEKRVAESFAQDSELLSSHGYDIEVELNQPGFVRAIVCRDGHATKVDWAHDSSWRFLPPVKHEAVGFMLHPIDLAINKVLALVGRKKPRDFLDTVETHRNVLSLGALCWAAAGKDPGFTPTSLLSLLGRVGAYRPEDFARLHLAREPDLVTMKEEWGAALQSAEQFIESRNPEELGCLYYAPEEQRFVGEIPAELRVVPHYGRPGGVMPRVDEDA